MKNDIYLMESTNDLLGFLKDKKLNVEDNLLLYYYDDTILHFKDIEDIKSNSFIKYHWVNPIDIYIDNLTSDIHNIFIEEASIFKKRDSTIYDFISYLNEIVYNYNIDMYISVNKLVLEEYKKFTRKIMNRDITYYQLVKN